MPIEDRYVHNVLRRIWVPESRRASIESDLRAHFARAREDGESAAAVAARLGAPDDVAAELMEDVELEHAGFWRRVAAFFADLGVLVTGALPIFGLVLLLLPRLQALDGSSDVELPAIFAVAAIMALGMAYVGIAVLYFPVFEKRFGKTPGKHLMRLRVRDESGAEIGWGQAIVRRLSLYFEFLALDALFVPFSEKKQRAFDMVADTVVVREPDRSPPGWRGLLAVGFFVLLAATPMLLGLAFVFGVAGASILSGG